MMAGSAPVGSSQTKRLQPKRLPQAFVREIIVQFLAVAMGLYHLIYQSQALVPFTDAELTAVLHQSRAYNRQVHVTGLLVHAPDGRFLQILEGEDTDVRQLYYQHILSDPRHHHCQVLSEGSCAERSFADWNMGFRVAQKEELHALLQHGALSAPTRHGPEPTVRPKLMELLLDFVAVAVHEPATPSFPEGPSPSHRPVGRRTRRSH